VIGIIIVAHGDIGDSLIKAAELILGSIDNTDIVRIQRNIICEKLRKEIQKKMEKVDNGDGVVILTDMFGGTPSNISLSFLNNEMVEVISGVNLPMLLSIIQNRSSLGLKELALRAMKDGIKGISVPRRKLRS